MSQRHKPKLTTALLFAVVGIIVTSLVLGSILMPHQVRQLPPANRNTELIKRVSPIAIEREPETVYEDQTFGMKLSLPRGWIADPGTLYSGDHILRVYLPTASGSEVEPFVTFKAHFADTSYSQPPLVANPSVYYAETTRPNAADVHKIRSWHMSSIDKTPVLTAEVDERRFTQDADPFWNPSIRFYVFDHSFREENQTRLLGAQITYDPQGCTAQTTFCATDYTLALTTIERIIESIRFTR